MATATQNNSQSVVRDITVIGHYPSGQTYSDTIQVGSTFEAMIRVMADRRYSDDGGDLKVSRVIDAQSGGIYSGRLLSADADLLSEVEAIEQVLEDVSVLLTKLPQGALDGVQAESTYDRLLAYIEYFGLVLAEAPMAFDGLTHGADAKTDEDMTLEFEDGRGLTFVFEPAEALLALAEISLQHGATTFALQVKTLATVARTAVNQVALDALADF